MLENVSRSFTAQMYKRPQVQFSAPRKMSRKRRGGAEEIGSWNISKIYQPTLLLLLFIKEMRSRGEDCLDYSFKVTGLEC